MLDLVDREPEDHDGLGGLAGLGRGHHVLAGVVVVGLDDEDTAFLKVEVRRRESGRLGVKLANALRAYHFEVSSSLATPSAPIALLAVSIPLFS